MNATQEGNCAGCLRPIHVGTPVLWAFLGRWHPKCVRKRYAGRVTGAGAKAGRLVAGGSSNGHRA